MLSSRNVQSLEYQKCDVLPRVEQVFTETIIDSSKVVQSSSQNSLHKILCNVDQFLTKSLPISGQFHIDPRTLIGVLSSLGITKFSVAGAGEDIAASILGDPLAPGNKLWNLQPGENPEG